MVINDEGKWTQQLSGRKNIISKKTVPLIPRALFQNQWRRTRGKLADPGSPGGNTIHTPV